MIETEYIMPGDTCWLMIDSATFKGQVIASGSKVYVNRIVYAGDQLLDRKEDPVGAQAKENTAHLSFQWSNSEYDGAQVPLRYLRKCVEE